MFRPHSTTEVEEVLRQLARERCRVRVVGALHSANDIAMSDEAVLVLPSAGDDIAIDPARALVTVPAGTTLHALNAALARAGFALPVLGSIADQTVAGAIATATHGTGLRYGTLSALVRQLEIVTPGHGRRQASRDQNPELFHAAQVSLGALGVHVSFTLPVVPAFKLRIQERPTTLAAALAALPERLRRHDHHRLWYFPHTGVVWEWSADRVSAEVPTQAPPPKPFARTWWNAGPLGRRLFEGLLWAATFDERWIRPINRWYAGSLFSTESHAVLPSVEGFLIDCLFRQHVDEWAVPLEQAAEAVRRVDALVQAGGFTAQLPIEIRFAPADDAWLSPCYGRACCYLGVISYRPFGRDFNFAPFFTAFEEAMRALGGRPHWGKEFRVAPAAFAQMYDRWDDFQRVRRDCDPNGLVSNRFTRRLWD